MHFASSNFWHCYRHLPKSIQKIADKNFKILKSNSSHPSLYFKKIGKYRSVRIGLSYRALAVESENGLLWFWIGDHSEYDEMTL